MKYYDYELKFIIKSCEINISNVIENIQYFLFNKNLIL